MVLRRKKCDKVEIKRGINQEKVPLFHLNEFVLFFLLLSSKNNIIVHHVEIKWDNDSGKLVTSQVKGWLCDFPRASYFSNQ